MQMSDSEKERAIIRIASGVAQYKKGDFQLLKVACFDEDEANWYKNYFATHYPDVNVSVTWLVFPVAQIEL